MAKKASRTTHKRYVMYYRRPTANSLAAQRSYFVAASDHQAGGGSLGTIMPVVNPHPHLVANHPVHGSAKTALTSTLQYLDTLHPGWNCIVITP